MNKSSIKTKIRYIILFLLLSAVHLFFPLSAQSTESTKMDQWNAMFSKAQNLARANSDSTLYYFSRCKAYTEQQLPDCQHCFGALEFLNVYRVYYSNDMEEVIRQGEASCERLSLQQQWQPYIDVLKYVGYAYKNQGRLAKASDAFFRALKATDQEGAQKFKPSILVSLAELFRNQDDLPRALEYAQQALSDFKDQGNWRGQLIGINEVANCYVDLEQYDQALAYYKQLLEPEYLKNAMYYDSSRVYNNLGRLYSLVNEVEKAAFYLNKSLAIRKAHQVSPAKLSFPLNELMTLYKNQGQYDQAMKYAQELLPLVDSISNIYQVRNIYHQYAQIQAGLGNFEQAYHTRQTYIELQDSIHRKDEQSIALELEARYETQVKEKEIALLSKDKQIASFQRNLIFAGSILAAGAGLLAFFFWSRKKNEEKAFLQAKAAQLQALDDLKTSFFNNITHELRTPLTLLLSPVNALLDGKYGAVNESTTAILQIIQRNGNQLKQMINGILDLAKVEGKKMVLREQSTQFYALINRLFASFESAASIKRLDYHLVYSASKSLVLQLDVDKCSTVINNLLSNALKFTPEYGKVVLRVSESDSEIFVEVNDNGRGIHPDDLPQVFDRFYQSTQPNLPQEGGTGIGLALSKEYASLMGGRIEVSSELGRSTVMALVLPKKIAQLVPAPEQATVLGPESTAVPLPTVKVNGSSSSKPRLLIVEDNPDMQTYLSSLLSSKFRLSTSTNGKVALRQLSEQPLPDLIISDVMMPEMDGFEFIRLLKANGTYAAIPSIMLTARATEVDKLKALRIGVDDYITKPFSHEELLVRIENLLANARARTTKPLHAPRVLANTNGVATSVDPKVSQQWLQKVESILLREISNKQFNMNSLADELHISQSKLSRQIKAMTGLTPNKYFLEIRLHKAKRHLEAMDFLTVAEVSYAIGFDDPNYFSRTYRRRYGKQPSSYLR
ncbi:MAG: ATP-binding protein [Bacteroidota bacterium]